MPFTSTDEKINKSGRPKGSMNKATAEIRERYLQLIFEPIENLKFKASLYYQL